jgi:hypothetical protein
MLSWKSSFVFPRRLKSMSLIPSRVATAVWSGLILALVALAIPAARADVVLYQTSFESPTFATGPISGQDGWSVFGPGISTVESPFAKTGSQAVFVDGGTASQSGPFHSDTTAGPLVDLSADIAIFTSSNQTSWQFAATGPGLIGFLGGIDIGFAGGGSSIQAITAGFPVIGSGFSRATAFDATAWHHIDLLFDIATQTYNITLDGSTLDSNVPFCGSNSGCTGAAVPLYSDGFFDSFGTGNDSGYMDNYQVALVNPVPEPSSVFLLVTVLGIGVGLRRKFSA